MSNLRKTSITTQFAQNIYWIKTIFSTLETAFLKARNEWHMLDFLHFESNSCLSAIFAYIYLKQFFKKSLK